VSVAAVVLAAGASTRLGRPKQTVVMGGETLVERAVRVAREAGLAPVIVVVREEEDGAARLREMGCVVVVNGEAAEGMAASIRCGVRVAETLYAEGVVVMACDQVLLRAEHLRALCLESGRVTASEYAGRRGVPAYFPAEVFGALMKLRGDVGAREMLRDAATVVDEGLAVDVDTEADVALAEERLRD
jgi:CTP:molybdopterin cytidylyltransferase MocA